MHLLYTSAVPADRAKLHSSIVLDQIALNEGKHSKVKRPGAEDPHPPAKQTLRKEKLEWFALELYRCEIVFDRLMVCLRGAMLYVRITRLTSMH